MTNYYKVDPRIEELNKTIKETNYHIALSLIIGIIIGIVIGSGMHDWLFHFGSR